MCTDNASALLIASRWTVEVIAASGRNSVPNDRWRWGCSSDELIAHLEFMTIFEMSGSNGPLQSVRRLADE